MTKRKVKVTQRPPDRYDPVKGPHFRGEGEWARELAAKRGFSRGPLSLQALDLLSGIDVGFRAQSMADELANTSATEVTATLLTADEMASPMFAATADHPLSTPGEADIRAGIGIRPAYGALTRAVAKIAPSSQQFRFGVETEPVLPAGGVPDGVAGSEVDVVFTAPDQQGAGYTVWAPMHLRNFDDSDLARDTINRILNRVLGEMVERDLTNGDGLRDATTERLLGVFNDVAVPTQARGVDTHLVAIEEALESVINQGFEVTEDVPLPIILPTAVWQTITTDLAGKSFSDALNGLVEPIVSSHAAATEAMIGRFDIGAVLAFIEGLGLTISKSHADFFSTRKVAVMLHTRAEAKVTIPAAFVKLTGM